MAMMATPGLASQLATSVSNSGGTDTFIHGSIAVMTATGKDNHNHDDKLDPNDFVIARKRKKYRFAHFANAENCFELDKWILQGATLLQGGTLQRKLVVEVGAGTGLFLVELAKKYPENTYIALDVKADRLQKGARLALEQKLTNIFFVRARADQLLEVVKEGTVSEIWLTFSDPFPKKSDAGRRLTHPKFLQLYKNIHVVNNARLYMKTDSHALFDWSLEQLVAEKWHIQELAFDLHESDLSDDYKIMTTYEQKWRAEGLPIYFVSASLPRG